jgi:hypothetical protein
MAVPANIRISAVLQDNRGFKARVSFNLFTSDVSGNAGSNPIGVFTVASLYQLASQATTGVTSVLQSMSNAKVVETSIQLDYSYAQEPSSETGEYQLVIQKAKLNFGDGNGGFAHLEVPAPVDSLFLTGGTDNMIVIDPTSSLITNLSTAFSRSVTQAAVSATTQTLATLTPRLGTWGAQFFGGQLVEGKPRVRRVLTGR